MRPTVLALATLALVVASACSGDTSTDVAAGATAGASPTPSPSPSAFPTVDPEGELCLRVAEMEERLSGLRSVELTLPNRTSLEIELDKLQAAHVELERVDLGDREDELQDSLKRLGYRMGELELAVEDFKTNPKPRRAVSHVEDDSQKVANELNAFVLLSRC
jgi:hypothetical protein